MTDQILCRREDLEATGAKEIVLDRDGARLPVFVVKFGERILGYVNSCPHARLPLNFKDDSFFDISRTFLFCSNHGAHFDAVTGNCIQGPCKGQSLKPFPIRLEGDVISAALDYH